MSEFYKTRMGQRFFEATMPKLVEQLTRLNDLLERLAERLEREEGGDAAS